MSKRNAQCIVVDDLPFYAPAGHTKLCRDETGSVVRLMFGCPCGCLATYGAGFRTPHGSWIFDGNEESPSVSPSLGCYAVENGVGPDGVFHWHGFLRCGVFEEC